MTKEKAQAQTVEVCAYCNQPLDQAQTCVALTSQRIAYHFER